MFKHWPGFVLEETAFVEQRELFDRLSDKHGVAPPVIDSDDLLENPAAIVEVYSQRRWYSLHRKSAEMGPW